MNITVSLSNESNSRGTLPHTGQRQVMRLVQQQQHDLANARLIAAAVRPEHSVQVVRDCLTFSIFSGWKSACGVYVWIFFMTAASMWSLSKFLQTPEPGPGHQTLGTSCPTTAAWGYSAYRQSCLSASGLGLCCLPRSCLSAPDQCDPGMLLIHCCNSHKLRSTSYHGRCCRLGLCTATAGPYAPNLHTHLRLTKKSSSTSIFWLAAQ